MRLMDSRAPVVIARVSSEGEASVIKSLLQGYGIPSHYTTGFPSRLSLLPDQESERIKISVPAALEKKALEILEEHRRLDSVLYPVED